MPQSKLAHHYPKNFDSRKSIFWFFIYFQGVELKCPFRKKVYPTLNKTSEHEDNASGITLTITVLIIMEYL